MSRSNRNKISHNLVKENNHKVIKEKFRYQREDEIMSKPLLPMNDKQKEFMDLIRKKSCIVATGFAGTSKSYIPAAMAADMYRLGQVSKIIVTRPAISSSKSIGFLKGDVNEKMQNWLGPVITVLKERMGNGAYDVALNSGDVQFIPLEHLKGSSFNNSFVIIEEASDLTKEELIKIVTRIGKGTTMTITGDILQSELAHGAGLNWLSNFITRNNMQEHFGFVEFNDYSHIVRSGIVKDFLINLHREEGITRV